MIELEFFIPGKPKGKGRPRFIKTGRTYTPEDTANYENWVRLCYMQEAKKNGIEPIPADEPVQVYIRAFELVPKSFSKARTEKALDGRMFPTKKPDCDNIIKIICDALNGVAYHDDKQVVRVSCRKEYHFDREGVFVTVERINV